MLNKIFRAILFNRLDFYRGFNIKELDLLLVISMILRLSNSYPNLNREKFINFCIHNFNTFHYLSLIDHQYVDQFFFANNEDESNTTGTFGALKTLFNLSLIEATEHDQKKIAEIFKERENEFTGCVTFQFKAGEESVKLEQPNYRVSTQRIIEVTGKGIQDNCQALIWAAITKKNTKWKRLLGIFLGLILTTVIISLIIKVSLLTRFSWNPNSQSLVNLAMIITLSLLLGGIALFLTISTSKSRPDKEASFTKSLKQNRINAKSKRAEEKKNYVTTSFVIIVKGLSKTNVEMSCQQIKTSIESLFFNEKITGKILLDEKNFLRQIYSLFGWSIKNIRKAYEKEALFKGTKTPIQLAINFFSLKTNLPSSSIEIDDYRYEVMRTKQGRWFIGNQYYSPQIQTPFYLDPCDLNQQALVCGPTGRGKSYFILELLACQRKHNPEIHFLLFDLKGEYVRFFGKDPSTLIIIPGSKEAPLGLNIFQIDEQKIDSNKRFVKNLLGDFLEFSIQQPELSPFMEDCINKAIDRTFKLPFTKRNLRTFVQMINLVIDQYKKEGVHWADSTKVALKARFRELFSGWFKRVFGVNQSNFNINILKRYDVIIKMDHLLRDNDLNTVKLITNSIMNLLSRHSEELHDIHSRKPWLICIFEEAQKLVPRIQKTDSSKLTAIESFMEIARAYGVSSIAVGQNPNLISERFLQAGLIADFGTESRALDNIIFTGEENPSAIASKEKDRLQKPGMCFLKISGSARVLLKINKFQPRRVLAVKQIKELIMRETRYSLLRKKDNPKLVPKGKIKGVREKNQVFKKLILTECWKDCPKDKCQLAAIIKKNKFALNKITIKSLREQIEDGSFFISALSLVRDRQDAPCIILYHILQLVVAEELSIEEGLRILRMGKRELAYL
ncbi:MAG: DUF87 domain-containing protein [Candidatus Heimdallarchaeota archaeon]|nr:DUF87 domain-containing protein [Candidatus Heimdallarchaeota archaeon]